MGQQPYFVLHHEHKVRPLGKHWLFFSVYPGLTTGGEHANIMTLEHNENRVNQSVADLLHTITHVTYSILLVSWKCSR